MKYLIIVAVILVAFYLGRSTGRSQGAELERMRKRSGPPLPAPKSDDDASKGA